MNQERIGSFISRLRREQNITQKELANKIGVSDKTISKWETGKSVPDITYIESVCTALGITMNELISGERLSEDTYPQKAEENLLNLIEEGEFARKHNLIAMVVGGIMLLVSFVMVIYIGYGENVIDGLLFYLDFPTLIILSLLSVACVLISGKRTRPDILKVLKSVSLPCGCLLTLITGMEVLSRYDNSYAFFASAAVAILPTAYAFIEYLVVVIILERTSHDKD